MQRRDKAADTQQYIIFTSLACSTFHNISGHRLDTKHWKSALCEVTKSSITSPSFVTAQPALVLVLTFDTALFFSPFPNKYKVQQSISYSRKLRVSSRLQTKG